MFDYQKIGQYLLKKRKQHKLTQKQLADQLQVSFQAVSKWEKGLSIPTVDLLNDIAILFDITVDEILKGEDQWPRFSYELSGVDVTTIDLINRDLKNTVKKYSYNPAFRGAAYSLSDFLFSTSSNIVSKVQEPVTKQIIAMKYGYIDDLIEDIVCMLINDILMIGAHPLFLTMSLLVNQANRNFLVKIVETFNEKAKKYNIKCLTGQCSVKPQILTDCPGLISTTMTGILDDHFAIDTRDICENDVILAIASNGLHHYGFSLIDMLMQKMPQIKNEIISGHNFLDEIMKPQYCYYDSLIDLIKARKLKGLVSISGCGFPRNLKRVIPDGFCAHIDLSQIQLPDIYHCLQTYLKIDEQEMLKTFNCGVGFIVIVSPQEKNGVLEHINRYFHCYQIGYVVQGKKRIQFNHHLSWKSY